MKIPYLLLYSFTFQMTTKTLKCVDQEKQDNFSCKHENTLKSMEFFESDEQLYLLTVCIKALTLQKDSNRENIFNNVKGSDTINTEYCKHSL